MKPDEQLIIAAVATALAIHDPQGLLKMGAPVDEYCSEIFTIAPLLKRDMTIFEVRAIAHQQFIRWFGSRVAGKIERYQGIAEDITRAIRLPPKRRSKR